MLAGKVIASMVSAAVAFAITAKKFVTIARLTNLSAKLAGSALRVMVAWTRARLIMSILRIIAFTRSVLNRRETIFKMYLNRIHHHLHSFNTAIFRPINQTNLIMIHRRFRHYL